MTGTVEHAQLLYRGRIFSVHRDRVALSSGHLVHFEVVRHPGSVVLLPQPAPGQIILIRQYRYTLDRVIWELPAGTLKPAEAPETAAARECEEEIGLVPKRVERVGAFYPTPGFCDEEMIFLRCLDLEAPPHDSKVKKDDDEEIETRMMTIAAARDLLRRGEIIDMKTALGLSLID